MYYFILRVCLDNYSKLMCWTSIVAWCVVDSCIKHGVTPSLGLLDGVHFVETENR